ncbi:chitobiase/beta-hexosaminidase C-terminal domain-containing protein, partial [Treponema primitia]|uniref:chitobiase/beta-hexosaminidase C-terminal domain-containing protein n=1 Tax=Treponema primitia TaxID=88058 RepID=UPI0039817DA5
PPHGNTPPKHQFCRSITTPPPPPHGSVHKIGVSFAVIAILITLTLTGCPSDGGGETETVVTPTANPPAGAVTSGTTIALSTTTAGAAIYFTTDGTTPTESSTLLYSNPIPITSAVTIKAIAVKSGMNASGILTAAYTILSSQTIIGTWSKPPYTLNITTSAFIFFDETESPLDPANGTCSFTDNTFTFYYAEDGGSNKTVNYTISNAGALSFSGGDAYLLGDTNPWTKTMNANPFIGTWNGTNEGTTDISTLSFEFSADLQFIQKAPDTWIRGIYGYTSAQIITDASERSFDEGGSWSAFAEDPIAQSYVIAGTKMTCGDGATISEKQTP